MRKLLSLLTFASAWLMSGLAFAQDAPVPPEGLEALPVLIEAAQGGQWSLFVSLLIMVLVWLTTKMPGLKDLIKGEAKIWTAAVAGILGAVATSVYVGDTHDAAGWISAVLQGLTVGLASGGLWSLVGRKVAGQSIDADGDGVLDELPAADEEDSSEEE